MRTPFLLPLLTLTLLAAEPLELRLQKAARLPSEALRQLQAELALAEVPGEEKAYHQAHLAYQLAARHQAKDPKADLAVLDQAIRLLEPRKEAESKALLGACLDVKIGYSPTSAMSLAPRASALFEAALRQSPGNPRVLMFQGIHVLHTPAFFGGGAEKALPILAAAVKAAEEEGAPQAPWAPSWGRAESCLWLAQAQRRAGREAEAQASLKRALELDPAFGHAQALLEAGR